MTFFAPPTKRILCYNGWCHKMRSQREIKKNTTHRCDNCGVLHTDKTLIPLGDVKHLHERLDPVVLSRAVSARVVVLSAIPNPCLN